MVTRESRDEIGSGNLHHRNYLFQVVTVILLDFKQYVTLFDPPTKSSEVIQEAGSLDVDVLMESLLVTLSTSFTSTSTIFNPSHLAHCDCELTIPRSTFLNPSHGVSIALANNLGVECYKFAVVSELVAK